MAKDGGKTLNIFKNFVFSGHPSANLANNDKDPLQGEVSYQSPVCACNSRTNLKCSVFISILCSVARTDKNTNTRMKHGSLAHCSGWTLLEPVFAGIFTMIGQQLPLYLPRRLIPLTKQTLAISPKGSHQFIYYVTFSGGWQSQGHDLFIIVIYMQPIMIYCRKKLDIIDIINTRLHILKILRE